MDDWQDRLGLDAFEYMIAEIFAIVSILFIVFAGVLSASVLLCTLLKMLSAHMGVVLMGLGGIGLFVLVLQANVWISQLNKRKR